MAGKASKKFDLGELTRTLSGEPEAVPKSGTLCMIPLNDLLPNPRNPYPLLWEGDMEKLMDSIEDAGLLEPVSAYPMGDGKYMLVSGHNRREAYRRLRAERDDGTHRWDKMPCVIAEAPDSAAKERIILVEANRQRVKTPKILTMEMETIGDAYYELVQAGQKPPGRKRDWIAKQMDITSARVGRLAKISKGLAPCYKPLWDAGDLPEDTADALAGLPQEVQERIKRVCPKKVPTARNIRSMGERLESKRCDYCTVDFHCPDGTACNHQDKFFRHDLIRDSWWAPCSGDKCCVKCRSGGAHSPNTCDAACTEMCAKARAIYEKAKAKQKDSEEREAAKARSKAVQKAMADAARIVRAADAAGLSDDTKIESAYSSMTTLKALREIAQGYITEDRSNYGLSEIIPYRTKDLTSMAQTLQCSTDYLLGLTDQLRPVAAEPGQMVLAAWMPGALTPPEPCEVAADVDPGDGGRPVRSFLQWRGGAWMFKNLNKKIGMTVIRWLRLPEVEKEENDDGD